MRDNDDHAPVRHGLGVIRLEEVDFFTQLFEILSPRLSNIYLKKQKHFLLLWSFQNKGRQPEALVPTLPRANSFPAC